MSFKRFLNLRSGFALVGLLVLIYLAQVAFAQDNQSSTPADVEATVQVSNNDLQIDPTDVTPTDEPSEQAPATAIPTDVVVTIEPTEVVATAIPTAIIPTQPTSIPAVISPALVTLSAGNTTYALNATVSVQVMAQNLSNVYSMALLCQADATHLRGTQLSAGNLLPDDQTTVLDNGFQANGQWAIIAAQHDNAPALQAQGVLVTLNYQVLAAGATQINCQIQLGDHNGQPLPLDNTTPLALIINGYQQGVQPTLAIPTAIPPVTVVVPTSPIPTMIIPTAVPSLAVYHLQGYISSPFPLMNTLITLMGPAGTQTAALQADKSFSFDLPAGSYHLMITARYYAPYYATITITDQPILLPLIKLHGGDVDGNGVVDEHDVAVVVADFGLAASAGANSPDLNGDGVINIYDLSIVSAGLRH